MRRHFWGIQGVRKGLRAIGNDLAPENNGCNNEVTKCAPENNGCNNDVV